MSENNNLTYYQRSREKILNKAKDYYKNLSEADKIKRREYAKNKYYIMSEEDRNKAREYAKNRYRNMSEEDKNKAYEYGKNRYHKMSEEDKYKNLSEEDKINEHNMKKIDVIICLKKKSKN